MNAIDRAVELSRSGCSCSQAVFGAFAPRFGVDEDTAVRVASGFGGGMRMGDACGALTGAFMALGLALGGDASRTAEGRQGVSNAVIECARRFRERHGAMACRDLLGCDIHTPEGKQQALDQNLFETKCRELVRDAAAIVESIVAARASTGAG